MMGKEKNNPFHIFDNPSLEREGLVILRPELPQVPNIFDMTGPVRVLEDHSATGSEKIEPYPV